MLTHDYNKNHELDICTVKKLFLYKDYDELIIDLF